MKAIYWLAIIAGILVAIAWVFRPSTQKAPLNASGYSYPSSPGA